MTIKEFTDAVLALDAPALAAAGLELTAAATAAGAATTAVDTAAKAVEAKSSVIAATRAQLAAAPTATEALALADALLQHEIGLHELAATLAAAQHGATLAKARVSRAATSVARAKQALADSTQASKAATDEVKAWQDNVKPLIDSLRVRNPAFSAAATTLKQSDLYTGATGTPARPTGAQARVELDVPQPLRDQARVRATDLQHLVNQANSDETAAETAAAGKYGAHLGEPGAVVVARLDYERKRRRLRDLADAERQLGDITTTLTAITTAPAASPGTVSRRDAAKLRVQAQQALIDAKQTEIDAAVAADKPPLQQQKLQLEAGLTPLNNIVEDAVPEEAWRRLYAFDAATEQLNAFIALNNAAITDIVTKASTAETVLATALKAEADGRRDIAVAEAALTTIRDIASAAREHGQAQLVAALRGDV